MRDDGSSGGRTFPAEAADKTVRYLRWCIRRSAPLWLQQDCEDLTQEAVIKVLEASRRAGRTEAFPKAYLEKVAFSVLYNAMNKRRLRKEEPIENQTWSPGDVPSHEPTPERAAAARQMGRAIRRCLSRIIAARRRIVVMALVGFANREIVEMLGYPRKRVENLLSRGRADLRRCLDAKGTS